MPSTITHSYFIMDIYNKLDIDTKILLKDQKDKLKLFSQSMDPLNFYTDINHRKAKKVRNFAETFHTTKTQEYLITLINYIKYNYYSNNPEALSYLYGLVSHYVLDSTIHPYIYYKTGEFIKSDKNTYKYNGKHLLLETNIDQYLIKEKDKIKPSKYKHYKQLELNEFSSTLKEIINFTFKETYNISNYSNVYLKAIKNMKISFKLLRYDPIGIKNLMYNFFDFIKPKKILNTKFLSYNKCSYSYNEAFNIKKNTWYNPVDKKIKSNKSFNDLYNQSIKNCIKLINDINDYLYDNKKVDLERVIKNISYKTNIELDKNQKLVNFEF